VVGYRPRRQIPGLPNLRRFAVRDILLVSSAYDFYILVEDAALRVTPRGVRGTSLQPFGANHTRGERQQSTEARRCSPMRSHIATLHIEDMPATRFAQLVRETQPDTPWSFTPTTIGASE